MNRFWHILIFFCYVTLASIMAVSSHTLFPDTDILISILAGTVLFLVCGLLQEMFIRRQDSAKSLRRFLLMKRALDYSRAELAAIRDEMHTLSETGLTPAGDHREAGLVRAQEGGQQGSQERNLAKASSNVPDPAEIEARSLFEQLADAEQTPPYRQPPPLRRQAPSAPAAPPAPRKNQNAASDRAMRQASSEVRVLHNLVEQLYTGRDTPPSSLSQSATSLSRSEASRQEAPLDVASLEERAAVGENTRRENPNTRAGFSQSLRSGLRIVADAASRREKVNDPLPDREESALLATVREALKEDRVDLYLQPIVSLPQRKRRFYECYSRVRAVNGEVIGPERYMDIARQAGLTTAIDNILLFRCIQLLQKLRRKDFSSAFFCNISPNTLKDSDFFKDFIQYMEAYSELASNLILEFSVEDFEGDLKQGLDQINPDLKHLGTLGCRFSLDGVNALDIDLEMLEELQFTFIKMDAATILKHLNSGGNDAAELRVLKQALDGHGIDLIVNEIETEAVLVELLDFNIDFGQGYLFGEPRPSKDPIRF